MMNKAKRRKVLFVNDNVLCGEALKLLFTKTGGFEITSEISFHDQIATLKQLNEVDLILLNAGLPFEIIIPTTVLLKKTIPDTPTVLINARKDDHAVFQCVINGIKGIVWIEDSKEQLIYVCKKVMDGERYLGLKESEIESYFDRKKNYNDYLSKITERELTVLRLFASGYSYKQIGDELNISPRTVESHKNNILAKLNLSSLKEMISYAIKNNLF